MQPEGAITVMTGTGGRKKLHLRTSLASWLHTIHSAISSSNLLPTAGICSTARGTEAGDHMSITRFIIIRSP